jgi:hypothetical protein
MSHVGREMKTLTIGLFLCVNICCGQETIGKTFSVKISQTDSIPIFAHNKDQLKRDSIAGKYSNWNQRARALEKYLLKVENPGITRDKNNLVEITLLNGETIQLKPDPNSDEADFTFENHFKQLKLLLFRVQWGEGNNYALIDLTNGKKTYIIGRPFFSPDRKFMIAINCDIEAQYSSNGFELFEISNRDFRKIWRYDPIIWGPVDMKWIDNSTLTTKNHAIDTLDGQIKTTYTKIKVKRNAP